MRFGPFISITTGIKKSLDLIKIGVNPIFCIGIYLGIIKTYTFNLKHIGKIKIDKSNGELLEYYRLMCYLKEDSETINKFFKEIINEDDIITIKNIKFHNRNKISYQMFFQRFYTDEYSVEDVCVGGESDKVVIDIGANIGDSALFFANKGYKVIAFEPIPSFYELALENIKLNPNLEEKIILVNKGISDEKGTIKIHYDSLGDGGASTYRDDGKYCEKIETITIKDIIEEYDVKNPFLLKMDCEGCEKNIICRSNLQSFKKIIFEYHTDILGIKYQKFIDKLEKQGFELVKKTGNRHIGVLHLEKDN